MSAAAALSMAREASVSISLEGNDLMLEAAYAPSPQLLEMISRHKSEIVALLRPAMDRWSTVEWEAFFQERLRIAECSMPTQEAGVLAFEQCVVQWLTRHPSAPSEPDKCLECHRGDEQGVVLPFGTEIIGHVWLHSDCWPAWHARRRTEAVAALTIIMNSQTTPSNRCSQRSF